MPIHSQYRNAWSAHETREKLLTRFPLTFRSIRFPEAYPSNIARFGIQCGPGWQHIVEGTIRIIEKELYWLWCRQVQNSTGELIAAIDSRVANADRDTRALLYPLLPFCKEISTTKGKLNIGLETGFFCDGETWERLRGFAECAATMAESTCEFCGKIGHSRKEHNERVYCDSCISQTPTQLYEEEERQHAIQVAMRQKQ